MDTTIILIIIFSLFVVLIYVKMKQRNGVFGNLPGPGTYEFDIVGESHYQASLEKICGGRSTESAEHYTEAILYLENDNAYDNKAVRVDIQGYTVGYFSRKDAREFRKQLQNMGHVNITCKCKALIVGGWERSKLDKGHFGVKLDLPVS